MVDTRARDLNKRLGLSQVRTHGGTDVGAGLGPTVARLAANMRLAANTAAPAARAPVVEPVEHTGKANGSTVDTPDLPDGMWQLGVFVRWYGTLTPFAYDLGSPPGAPGDPPFFYGEVIGLGGGIRDVRPISMGGTASPVIAYRIQSDPVSGGGAGTVTATAFPPSGYGTAITFDMTISATWLRPDA